MRYRDCVKIVAGLNVIVKDLLFYFYLFALVFVGENEAGKKNIFCKWMYGIVYWNGRN